MYSTTPSRRDSLESFNLNLRFDGTYLEIDYNDGSDIERRFCPDTTKLMAEIKEAVGTAMAKED